MNQGFECEIDDRDWICCNATDDGLVIEFVSQNRSGGGITIGRDQIQNLIDYLESVKKTVQEKRK